MDILPIGPLIYVFNGTMAFWYGMRNYYAFKKNQNEYSRMFFKVGLGVAVAEYLFGLPFLMLRSSHLWGLAFTIGILPLYFGLNYALIFSLREWIK